MGFVMIVSFEIIIRRMGFKRKRLSIGICSLPKRIKIDDESIIFRKESSFKTSSYKNENG